MDKKALSKCIEDFRTETNLLFSENQQEPATIGDLSELAEQTYYVFNEILNALE